MNEYHDHPDPADSALKTIIGMLALVGIVALGIMCEEQARYLSEGSLHPKYRDGARAMAQRWDYPQPNNAQFMADYRYYMGHDYHDVCDPDYW